MKDIKKCTRCGEVKPISEFSIRNAEKGYISSHCKKCNREKAKLFSKTKQGVVNKIYFHQCETSNKRNFTPPSYTRNELKEWIFGRPNFNLLYNDWIKSGYDRWTKPSVDRKDDYKGYSLDNIQLMTWQQNSDKACSDRVNGINNKKSKAVLQYDLDGNFIKEYYSARRASKETGVHFWSIGLACKEKMTRGGNFIWKYKY